MVTNLNDSGSGTLRYWINGASPGDTITFAPGLAGVITLTSGALAISNNLNVTGPGAASLVVNGNQKIVQDGPYAEAKDMVGGYIVVEANDLAHAVELSKGCPILEVGGSVEVRPVQIVNM